MLPGDEIVEKNSAELEKHSSFNISHTRLETFPEIWILFLALFMACFMTLTISINLSIPQVDLSKLRITYPCLPGSQVCEVERVNGRKFKKHPEHCLSESLQSVLIGNLQVSVLDSGGLWNLGMKDYWAQLSVFLENPQLTGQWAPMYRVIFKVRGNTCLTTVL